MRFSTGAKDGRGISWHGVGSFTPFRVDLDTLNLVCVRAFDFEFIKLLGIENVWLRVSFSRVLGPAHRRHAEKGGHYRPLAEISSAP